MLITQSSSDKCRRKNRFKVENCDMRHHILVHEVHLRFIEGAKAKRESEQVPEAQKLRETQRLSPWKVKSHHHVRLRSLLRCIGNLRIHVVRLVVVLWLNYFL